MLTKKPREKRIKLKKCKNPKCREPFIPERPLQSLCSPLCAQIMAIAKRESEKEKNRKKERAELRAAKERMKKKSKWKAEAQAEFNGFIRARDHALPCVSCGRQEHEIENTTGGKWDCGHYLSRGAHPELAFEEKNAHKQCKNCNGGAGKFAHKNETVTQNYRIELIKRIGIEKVEWLEGKRDPKNYTIDDFKDLKRTYREKRRVAEKAIEDAKMC